MAWDDSQQFSGGMRGLMVETGEYSFSTTGLTVELPTYKSVIHSVVITAKATTGALVETFFCDQIVTSGAVTVTREVKPIYLSGGIEGSTDSITSYDWIEVPIATCPVAGALTGVYVYNVVKAANALLELGIVPTYGAGSAAVDSLIDAANDSGSDHAMPASSAGGDYSAVIAGGNNATSSAVAAGDVITLSTTTGDTADPAGINCTLKIVPTPTSGLTFNYIIYGR